MRGNPLIRVFFLANEPINSVGLERQSRGVSCKKKEREKGKKKGKKKEKKEEEKKASPQQSAPLLLTLCPTSCRVCLASC